MRGLLLHVKAFVPLARIRDGRPYELTSPHKADRDSEAARIRAGGGFVTYDRGVPRVAGILQVSRSVGMRSMKREYTGIIVDPFVRVVQVRCEEEEENGSACYPFPRQSPLCSFGSQTVSSSPHQRRFRCSRGSSLPLLRPARLRRRKCWRVSRPPPRRPCPSRAPQEQLPLPQPPPPTRELLK